MGGIVSFKFAEWADAEAALEKLNDSGYSIELCDEEDHKGSWTRAIVEMAGVTFEICLVEDDADGVICGFFSGRLRKCESAVAILREFESPSSRAKSLQE